MADETLLGEQVNTDTPAGETDNTTTPETEVKAEQTTETEQQEPATDGEQKADTEAKEEKAEPKAPEKYDIKAPEGMELDSELLSKFDPVFRDLDLSNEQANKLASLYGDHMKTMQEAQANQWAKVQETWVSELKADQDFGGANFDTNVETAKVAIQRFGGEGLVKALNETGMGNHPEIIKFAHKVGLAISEDKFIQGNESGGKVSLYPNSNMNR